MSIKYYYSQFLVRYTNPNIKRNKIVLAFVSFVLGWRIIQDWFNVINIGYDIVGAIFVYLIITALVSSILDLEEIEEEIEEENEELEKEGK